MRHKPRYNNLRLTYVDLDGNETRFYCNDVTSNKNISFLIGMPIKDSGSRFRSSSDIDFEIDAKIIMGYNVKIITELPKIKIKGNNARRGLYRGDKVIVTT